MSEERKYEFNLDDPDSWSKMPKPLLTEQFVKETNKIGGYVGDKPRFKWAWGMSEEVYIESDGTYPSGYYLKYQLCSTETLVGFSWVKDGIQGKCFRLEDIPHDVLVPTPIKRIAQIGIPRWVLEEYRQAGDENGMYDRDGYYFSRWIVEDDQPENPDTLLKPYREPNYNDLEILRGYIKAKATLTDADIRQGVAAIKESEAAAKEQKREEVREEIAETFLEMMPQMPKMPAPPKAVIQKAWAQLEQGRTK
jgi:uncharacterized protein (UPF0147 family)